MLSAGLQVGHQRHMDIAGILPAHFQAYLPDCFNKGLAFNIADCTADFRNHHICVGLFADPIDKPFDLIRNMRNRLYGGSQIAALPFLLQNVRVYLAGGQVGVLVQVFVNEPLIMSQVQVGFRAVFGHIDFSVLIGTHGSRIRIDIGIQLLCRHFQSPGLQKPPQARCRDSLSQT